MNMIFNNKKIEGAWKRILEKQNKKHSKIYSNFWLEMFGNSSFYFSRNFEGNKRKQLIENKNFWLKKSKYRNSWGTTNNNENILEN